MKGSIVFFCLTLAFAGICNNAWAQKPTALFGNSPTADTSSFLSGIPKDTVLRVEIVQRRLNLQAMPEPGPNPSDAQKMVQKAGNYVLDNIVRYGSLGYAVHYEIVLKTPEGVPIESFGYSPKNKSDTGLTESVPGQWHQSRSPKELASVLLDYDKKPVYAATMTYEDYIASKAEVMALPDTGYMAFGEQCQTHAGAFTRIAKEKPSTNVTKTFQEPAAAPVVKGVYNVGETAGEITFQLTHHDSSSQRVTPSTSTASPSEMAAMEFTTVPQVYEKEVSLGDTRPPQAYETIDYRPAKNWATETINSAYSQATEIADDEGFGAEYRSRVLPIVKHGLNNIQSIPDQVQVPVGQ